MTNTTRPPFPAHTELARNNTLDESKGFTVAKVKTDLITEHNHILSLLKVAGEALEAVIQNLECDYGNWSDDDFRANILEALQQLKTVGVYGVV